MDRKKPVHHEPFPGKAWTPIVFVTCVTADRKRILDRPPVHDLIRETWLRFDHWVVGRYVIMPDHIHFFCSPNTGDSSSLSVWMKTWKAAVSRRWPDRDEQPIWQLDHWDTELRRGESYDGKWAYVLENPVRAGLVELSEDWPYAGQINELIWN